MSGLMGISAYMQMNESWKTVNKRSDKVSEKRPQKANHDNLAKETEAGEVEVQRWSPIDTSSSLVPRQTEYGNTIGNVQLSDKAKEYYSKLKSKFHNLDFIAVSKDMKAQVQQNAASYGNSKRMVVLIDEEKLERMATDESFRKKYEGIIAMSQSKLSEAKNSLVSSGANVKNFGMSVDSNGKESFFATVEKSQDLQKKRIEKKAAEKKEKKLHDKKAAEKKAREERIRKRQEDKKSEKTEDSGKDIKDIEDKEFVTIESDSMESLISKVQKYSYSMASDRVLTNEERMIGRQFDFRG